MNAGGTSVAARSACEAATVSVERPAERLFCSKSMRSPTCVKGRLGQAGPATFAQDRFFGDAHEKAVQGQARRCWSRAAAVGYAPRRLASTCRRPIRLRL